jgi:hypothetical protein
MKIEYVSNVYTLLGKYVSIKLILVEGIFFVSVLKSVNDITYM